MIIRLLAATSLLWVLSLPGTTALAQGDYDLQNTKQVLTEMIQKALKERGVPSISIALVKGDQIVWKEAFGYANVRTKTPATPATLYSTGSTFKSATATALMQLVEKGKLDLDHPVNRYLGDDRVQDRLQDEKAATFRHILSHWSGLVPGANTKPIWGRELPKPLERMVAGLYSIRAPEAKWEYNNYAYGMAGLLVERIANVEYEKYMVEHVLQPLGVETPHPVYPSPDMVELMALPYMPGGPDGKPRPVAQVHYDVYPAGDIYLTAEDMARFLGAHLNGGVFNGQRILSEESVKIMHTAQFGGTYALGFSVKQDDKGHTIISHGGGIPGQSSMMMGDVDARVGAYFMSNSGGPSEIAEAAIALLRGEKYVHPDDRETIAVSPTVLDRYIGAYTMPEGLRFTVARKGPTLFVKTGNDDGERELLPFTTTQFGVKGMGWTLTFATNGQGAVTHLALETSGQTIRLDKK